jgi:hypothetical protein
MNNDSNPVPQLSDIQAARMLLDKMGINPADLMRAPTSFSEPPTFADYIPRVSSAVSSGTRRVYGSYWNRVIQAWGSRPLPLSFRSCVPFREIRLCDVDGVSDFFGVPGSSFGCGSPGCSLAVLTVAGQGEDRGVQAG